MLSSPPPTPTTPPAGWTTFQEAATVAVAIANQSVIGPWNLAFAEGLAAIGPWAPPLDGILGPSPACAARLGGVSLFSYWNSSEYPETSEPSAFTSGTAGIWTFGFIDAAGDAEIISVVNGSGTYNGLWPVSSHCVNPGSGVAFAPRAVADSPALVRAEAKLSASLTPAGDPYPSFDPLGPGPAFELYSLGTWLTPVTHAPLNLGESSGGQFPTWWAVWGRCGLPGVSGDASYSAIGFNASDPGPTVAGSNSPQFCTDVGAQGSLGAPTTGTFPKGAGTFESWGLSITPLTSGVPPPSGWNVVHTDSITPALFENNSSGPDFGAIVPSGAAVCGPGTPALTDCTPSLLGWYAVLIDPQGNWLDSFPAAAGGSTWTRSGVSVSSGDQIELIFPSETPTVKEFLLLFPGPSLNLGIAYVDQ